MMTTPQGPGTATGGLGGRRAALLFGGLGTAIAAVVMSVLLTTQPVAPAIPLTPSAGCGQAAPVVPARLTQLSMTYPVSATAPFTASVANPTLANRTYQLYLPDGYNNRVAYPLVVVLHALNMTATQMEQLTRLDDLADKMHFIAVYPQGTVGQAGFILAGDYGWDILDPIYWGPAGGTIYGAYNSFNGVDDAGFLDAVRQSIERTACVSTHQEGAFGFSAGAGMAVHLLCAGATWPRAYGMIGISIQPFTNAFGGGPSCSARHVGAMWFVGKNDTTQAGGTDAFLSYESMTYLTGDATYDTYKHVATGAESPFVASAGSEGSGYGCTGPSVAYSSTEVFEQTYTGCQTPTAAGVGPNDSALFSIPQGNHAIPGGWYLGGYGCTSPESVSGGLGTSNSTCQVSAPALIARFIISGATAVDPASTPVPPLNASVPVAVAGQTYYVSKSGSNADGLSWASAWNELNQINWTTVHPGDTILIDGGPTSMTYTTTLVIGKSGNAGAPITLSLATASGHNGQAIFFGGRSTPLPYCGQVSYTYQTTGVTQNGIVFHGNSYVTVDGTKWHGIVVYGHNYDAVTFESPASHDSVSNLEVYDNGLAEQQSDGTWMTDRNGVVPYGDNSDLTFSYLDIHDNGQDNFQSGGPLNNFILRHSWLHYTRNNPLQGPEVAYNYPCTHQDGLEFYDGGLQNNFDFEEDVIGPGLMQGIFLGAHLSTSGPFAGQWATMDNVTIHNTLMLDDYQGTSIIAAAPASPLPDNWHLDHVTMYVTMDNAASLYEGTLNIPGTNHSVTNSVFYGGVMTLPDGLAQSSGNCQWNTTGPSLTPSNVIQGQTVDPQFVSDVSLFGDHPALATEANANYALQGTSPCLGKGSSITSVAQLIATAQ